jgi:hypothetical protein
MTEEETVSSKLFWWFMGIVSAVVSAEVIAALGLSGVSVAPFPTPSVTVITIVPRPSTAASSTTPPIVTPNYSGTYFGSALNHEAIGSVWLEVDQIDPASGSTTAQVNWSGELSGAGPLQGTFVANNATFSGEIDSQEGPWNIQLNCTFSDGTKVTCRYQLQPVAPNHYAPQQGSLTARK